MKKMKNYLLALLAVAGFIACSDDDPGMAPVIEGDGNITLELKRDTADTYKINLPIVSEEGIAKITLMDKSSNKVLDEQTSFADPNTFTYTYDVDLTTYTENTTLMLSLTVEDREGQIVTQNITLNIKKFSELDVRFTADQILTFSENCNLKLTVIRGLIPLKEMIVKVEGKDDVKFDLSMDSEQEKYDFNVRIEDLELGDNKVTIVVVDEKDQEFNKSVVVERKEGLTFKSVVAVMNLYDVPVFMVNGADMNGEYHPNIDILEDIADADKLYRLAALDPQTMSGYHIVDFYYGENDMVTKLEKRVQCLSKVTYEIEETKETYEFIYEGEEVVKVTKDGVDYVTNIVYESGSIKSFNIDGELYTPQYAEKEGEMVRVDNMDAELSGNSFDFTDKEKVNPLYMENLPALLPLDLYGMTFSQYVYNRYFFNSMKDGGTELISYEISDVTMGDMEMMQQVISWTDENEEEQSIIYYYNE